jgi:hypothetical protein
MVATSKVEYQFVAVVPESVQYISRLNSCRHTATYIHTLYRTTPTLPVTFLKGQ